MTIYERIQHIQNQGQSLMLITVVDKQGEGPAEVGNKMIVSSTKELYGTVGGGALEHQAIETAKACLKNQAHAHERYVLNDGKIVDDANSLPMVCGGVITLYYEYIGTGKSVYIFGAGHVSKALVNVLKTLPFHITVIDYRSELIDTFEGADVCIKEDFVTYIKKEGLKPNSMVIVCTPSHRYDYDVINTIIEQKIELDYIGMLCSKSKIKDYLSKTYETFGHDINLNHFYSPIGLDLGGSSPEAIAISITAELLTIINQKKNHQHMRQSIHKNLYYWK